LKSKFSIVQAVFIPFVLLLVNFAFGGCLILIGAVGLSKPSKEGYFFLIAGLVFLGLFVLIVRHYLRVFAQITVDEYSIAFRRLLKTTVYNWSDVQSIKLLGKEYEFGWIIFDYPMEAATLEFLDGSREVVFIKYYANMDRIRTALHVIRTRIEEGEKITEDCFIPISRTQPAINPPIDALKFGRNHLLTFNGIFAHSSWIFLAWLWLFANNGMGVLPKLGFTIYIGGFFYGILGFQLHYFRLNGAYLMVRNHCWLWRRHNYRMKDIREIVVEEPHKMSTAIRVITTNYEDQLYPSGSINKKSWIRLMNEFARLGIPVRNETYYEWPEIEE